MRGADLVARALAGAGVKTVFTLSGNQIMSVFDALLDTDIRLVHTRHEAAAGFMAEGHARLSGGVGVALVTAGAGLGNAITPLITAAASQTPLLLLSGDSPVALDGRGAFQEMPQIAMTEALTKWSVRITDPEQVEPTLAEAFERARAGQPGPVHVALPDDVLKARVAPHAPFAPPTVAAPAPDTAQMLAALDAAEQPLILLGPGVAGPAAAGNLPLVRMQSPRGRKDPALGRFGALWAEADLVVVLGKPVDFSLGFGAEELWPRARWITVHGDPAEAARARRALGGRLVAGIEDDPAAHAAALAGVAAGTGDWLDRLTRALSARAEVASEGLTSATLCRAVAGHVASLPSPVVIADGGEFGQWAQALVPAPRRIINGVSGVIGAGICYAIGAKLADPQADVVLLMGDGTAGFHFTEFETAAREGIGFTAIIGNDRRWNAEHALQLRDYGAERTHGCTLSDARYDRAAEALGATGLSVDTVKDVAAALARARTATGPVCLDVRIDGLLAPEP